MLGHENVDTTWGLVKNVLLASLPFNPPYHLASSYTARRSVVRRCSPPHVASN